MGRITEVNMNELVAKPIIKDQFWVVTDGEKKVGNVLANSAGYEVILNGSTLQFNNTKDIQKKTKINFQPIKSNKTTVELPYPDYPVPNKIYNSFLMSNVSYTSLLKLERVNATMLLDGF